MIEVTHYIGARQTGKTGKAKEMFLNLFEQDSKTYIVIPEAHMKEHYRPIPPVNIISATNLLAAFKGRRIRNLIIDEYLISVKDKILFLHQIIPSFENGVGKIFLFSTPDKKYSQREIEEKKYMFLDQQNHGIFQNRVIHTIKYPEKHGFKKIYKEDRMLFRNNYFNSNNEKFEAEMLGLYRYDQVFEKCIGFYIEKPKKFTLKACFI